MTALAPSNLTNAIAAFATGLDQNATGVQTVIDRLGPKFDTVMQTEDEVYRKATLDEIRVDFDELRTLADHFRSMADQIQQLASQIPSSGSTATTTGAVGTTDGGTGVVGVPGTAEDEAKVPTDNTQTPVVQGTGIVGNTPSDVAPTDPETQVDRESGK